MILIVMWWKKESVRDAIKIINLIEINTVWKSLTLIFRIVEIVINSISLIESAFIQIDIVSW